MLGSLFRSPPRRARRAARPAAAYAVETLEHRVVLSAASPRAAAAAAAQADVSAQATLDTQVLEITDVAISSLEVIGDQLIATADIAGNLLGQDFNLQDVEIPFLIDQIGQTDDGCPILNLTLGPIDLNVLGLDIELDNCEGDTVEIEITAIPSAMEGGGLLGDLLCGVAGALDDLNLGNLLGSLTGEQLDQLTDGLNQVLEGLLGQLLGGSTLGGIGGGDLTTLSHSPGHGGGQGQGQGQGGGSCDILSLEIPEGINLNVLGLQVQTSGICLDIDAERGSGNLLGNLLCSVTHLLDNPSSLNAVFAQVNRLGRLLDRL